MAHARVHFDFIQRNSDGIHLRPDPDNPKGVHLIIRKAKSKPLAEELLVELEVKHTIESLRSALEYLAFEIFEKLCCEDPSAQPHRHTNVFFPVPRADEGVEEFGTKLDGVFPGLRTEAPDAFGLLIGMRANVSGENVWLDTLHSGWNEMKHRRLASSSKPMAVAVAGFDSDKIPPVVVRVLPDTSHAVLPNLRGALDGVTKFIAEAKAALLSSSSV